MEIAVGTICVEKDLKAEFWRYQGSINGTQIWEKKKKMGKKFQKYVLYYDTKEKKVKSLGPKVT